LKKEILERIQNPRGAVGFYLKRQDTLFGKKLKFGETGKARLLRLARRDAGKWERRVHEVWNVLGRTEELNQPLLHYPHQAITQFLERINFYSTLHARALFEEREQTNLFQIISYPTGKFIQNYILRLGCLDGMPGLILTIMMSLHSFLARGKLYLLWKKGPPEYQK
jgi:hypothetical protein